MRRSVRTVLAVSAEGALCLAGTALLTHNPNEFNPQRLTPDQALACDQDHGYTAEQSAANGGLMNRFVQETGSTTCSAPNFASPGLVMDYYDGNTVTGLWNYAQRSP